MAKRIVDEEMRFTVLINGDEAQQELFKLEKTTKELTRANKNLKAERDKLKALGKEETAEYKKITASIKENSAEININEARMQELRGQIGITSLTMKQLREEASRLRTQLHNMTPGSSEYIRLQGDLKAIDARMKELRLNSRATESSISSLANGFNKYFALGASIIATGTGVVISIQKMIDYNSELSDAQADVMKTTQMTKEEIDEFTASLGLLKTRTARIELLKLAEQAGRLGITGVDNLKAFVKSANEIKVALGDDLSEEAIQEVGKITNIYKVGEKTGKDFAASMTALGSAINEVSASGANQAGFLVDYLKRQSGIAAQAKISAEQNLGYAATFDEIGQSVEVSATAMNKVWMDLFENPQEYAKIAKMSLEDFTNLLNTDANEAMLRFLEGLNGNNSGLALMTEKLKDIEVGGARGAQSLSAIAGATELLRSRQETASRALQDATSITNEYNIKNNNLAATLDKVKKQMIGAFASPAIIGGVQGLLNLFASLIGATEDLDAAFAKDSKASYESALANRKLADESSALLKRYEELKADGVEPTTEAKEELDLITLQLKDRLGESVMSINQETGAYLLNTEAVREQIKLKRLAADEEASTMVSRLKGTEDEIIDLEKKGQLLEKEYDLRKKFFESKNQQDIEAIENTNSLSANEKQALKERMEGYKEFTKARSALQQNLSAIDEQEKRRQDLLSKLGDLNYDESIVDQVFKEPTTPEAPVVSTPGYTPVNKTSSSDFEKRREEAKRQAAELLKIQEENERLKASLISESFQREIEIEEVNHQQKLASLRSKMADEAALKAADPKTRAILIDQNKALNSQIELEEQVHQNKIGSIIHKGLEEDFKQREQAYQREKVQRETAHNLALAALGNDEVAKKALQEKFDQEEKNREVKHLEDLKAEMQRIISAGNFEGFDLELLSPEEKQKVLDALDEIGLKLSEVINKKNSLQGNEGIDLGAAGGMDIFGFTADDWKKTFQDMDSLEDKLAGAAMAVGGLSNAYAMYQQFRAQAARRELEEFDAAQKQKENRLQRQLDAGLINQRQYSTAVRQLEKESEKERAKLEYESAKRQWNASMSQAIGGAAMAVLNGLQAKPFLPVGLAMGALAGVLGGLQVAMVAKSKPVKGFEKGLYPVKRQQDGKTFQAAYGGETRSGLVDRPTMFLAGEGGKKRPEMIIDDGAWAKMDPAVKESIYNELGRMGRVPGYERGLYRENTSAENGDAPNPSAEDTVLLAVLGRAVNVLEKLERNGVIAYMSRDLENAKKIQDDINDYNKLRNANKR